MAEKSEQTPRKLLIVGATGRQGSSVIDAILSKPLDPPFQILALTRDLESPKAQALAAKHAGNPNITIIQGESSCPDPIFEAHGSIYGIFCYTIPSKVICEESQAKV